MTQKCLVVTLRHLAQLSYDLCAQRHGWTGRAIDKCGNAAIEVLCVTVVKHGGKSGAHIGEVNS
eukprot:5581257-Amphidinium_carterae.1